MPNSFNPTPPNVDVSAKKFKSSFKNPNIPGTITNTLGTGENAKDSIIYLTLKWSFISGTIITILIVINHWCFRKDGKVPDFVGDVKVTWDIIIPIITLALGYYFGKSNK